MKLSIIIPVYNASKYIENCLNSIYKQEAAKDCFEVIVVNDGSTDDSKDKVQTYAEELDNLKLINKVNGGVSSARNLGIEFADGEFVLFVDADDELVEGSLQHLYDYLCRNLDIDMLITKQSRFNSKSERVVSNACGLQEGIAYSGVETYKRGYVRGNAGGAICRTAFLRQTGLLFPTGIKNGEDTIFFGLVHVYAKKIVLLNVLLYRINEVSGSASRTNYDKVGLNFSKTLNRAIEIRNNIDCDLEQRGIMEYVVYRLLSHLTTCYIRSKNLSYRQLRKDINFKELLPFNTKLMYRMRRQAKLINISYCLFYLLSYIRNIGFNKKIAD